MRLDTSLSSGDGIENLRYTMANIILNDTAYKKSCQENSHNRIDQIEVVCLRSIEILRQEVLYPVDEHLQNQGRKGCEDTDHETQDQNETLLFDMVFAPHDEATQPLFICCFYLSHNRCIHNHLLDLYTGVHIKGG